MKKFLKVIGWLAMGLVGLAVIAVIFDRDASGQLEVRTEPGLFGYMILIKNVGQEPITINGVKVNNRTECVPAAQDKAEPEILKVGETAFRGSICEVVRATIGTNKGSIEYTFKR